MRIYFLPFLFLFIACSEKTSSTEEALGQTEAIAENGIIETREEAHETQIETSMDQENSESSTGGEYDDVDWDDYIESMSRDYSYVILISTKSYAAALKRAKEASEKLGYPLDLRDLHENPETGLSLPKEQCEEICGGAGIEYPQYLPRNDWGESKYVSVEYSNGYSGFTKGYYIVIIASGEKGDPIIHEALEEARKFYEDAYAKTCSVYMGCSC